MVYRDDLLGRRDRRADRIEHEGVYKPNGLLKGPRWQANQPSDDANF